MGRPPAYHRETLLRQIVACLWDGGYAGTTISEVVKNTRVNAASLYGLFGSKKGMMLAALEHYAAEHKKGVESALQSSSTGPGRVEALLRYTLKTGTARPENRGCFLVNSVLECASPTCEISQAVRGYMRDLRERIERALEEAPPGPRPQFTPAEAAAYVQAQMWALALHARLDSVAHGEVLIRQTLDMLFGREAASDVRSAVA